MIFRSKSRDADTENVTGTLPFPRDQHDQRDERGLRDERDEDECEPEESTLIKTVGWISAGLGAVALGLFIGRELRQRYQFNRQTPYDLYAHSGDELDVDSGLGI